MFYPQSDQLYRYEHGLSAAEQRVADVRAGEVAAGLRDLRLRLGRAVRLGRRVRPVREPADAIPATEAAAPARALAGYR